MTLIVKMDYQKCISSKQQKEYKEYDLSRMGIQKKTCRICLVGGPSKQIIFCCEKKAEPR